jgi:hypothetical protein
MSLIKHWLFFFKKKFVVVIFVSWKFWIVTLVKLTGRADHTAATLANHRPEARSSIGRAGQA